VLVKFIFYIPHPCFEFKFSYILYLKRYISTLKVEKTEDTIVLMGCR